MYRLKYFVQFVLHLLHFYQQLHPFARCLQFCLCRGPQHVFGLLLLQSCCYIVFLFADKLLLLRQVYYRLFLLVQEHYIFSITLWLDIRVYSLLKPQNCLFSLLSDRIDLVSRVGLFMFGFFKKVKSALLKTRSLLGQKIKILFVKHWND